MTRYWPRGVAKQFVHEWRRELAPSVELLSNFKQALEGASRDADRNLKVRDVWVSFSNGYRDEMSRKSVALDELRGRLARGEMLTLLCACHKKAHCHRSLLAELLAPSRGGT